MLNYETLDVIADAYTPALAVLSLIYLGQELVRRQWSALRQRARLLASGLAIAYGLMFIDASLALWPSLGLDYSTHTAVAFVFVGFLSAVRSRLWLLWGASLISYFLLMLYQQYHTLTDIVTTLLAMAAVYLPIVVAFRRRSTRM